MSNHIFKKLSPYNMIKGFHYLKHYGPREFMSRVAERMQPDEVPYEPWYEAYRPTPDILEAQRSKTWEHSLKFSVIVPAFHTPEDFLCQMLESVQAQTYSNWELCIANASSEDTAMRRILENYSLADSRIRFANLSQNTGISQNTNAALAIATGDFVCLLDHDDLLAPNALYEAALALERNPEIDVMYTDEDKVTTDLSKHFQPHLKPDYSPDLLRSNNYICHFFLVRATIARAIHGFRPEFDGAQDYDFIFRCIEQARIVCHIPEILYHWRVHKSSTADNPISKKYAFEAGRQAIESHLKRMNIAAHVELKKELGFYRTHYDILGEPLISILIPNCNEAATLKNCIDSIESATTYANYEIIVIENNSNTDEITSYYRSLECDSHVHIITWNGAFNYSAINNFGAAYADGEYLVLLNNDTQVISPNWLEEMLGICQRQEVGIVGAKLYYPDKTIQHAGTVIGIGGSAGHVFTDLPGTYTGYMHKASLQLNYSAVTAACMMVKKTLYNHMHGLDSDFRVAFNDVDFCLRVRESGYLIVYTPYAELYHFESKSRGPEDNPAKVQRFQDETALLKARHPAIFEEGDPYYNKNLSLTKWNYSLRRSSSRKQA